VKKFLRDKRYQLIVLLFILFLIKVPQEDIRYSFWILGGTFLAAICDFLIKLLFLKQRIIPKSAIISGFIVSGIINYHEPWHILIIFSLLAIISKNIIKFKNQNIFNPAGFALFIATLFRIPLAWNIESNIYLIIVWGLYFAYSLKKIYHILGFLITFLGLLFSLGTDPLRLISWFFIFIMLIEPKTSGFGLFRGLVFGSIAGITSFLTFEFFSQYDFFIVSLFIANLFNPLLDKLKR
jgi:hypothetical protein